MNVQTRPAATPPETGLDRRLVTLGAVVVLGAILSVLDATVVNVAVRTLGEHFGASVSTIQWVLTGYLLGFASVIPVTGWAGERFGAKRVWISALLLFTLGSVLAGSAWSVPALIGFRVLQGLGGGMILPVGQAILARAAGPHRMARVMSFIGVPLLLGSVAGPVVGGLIVSITSWRWIFFINVPIGVIAVLVAYLLLPDSPARPRARLDARGLGLISSAVTLFVYGMSEAGTAGFGTARAWAPLAAVVVLMTLYGVHARARRGDALIDTSLFRHRGFTAAAVTNLVVAIALFGVMVLLPLYWQVVRGHDPLATGTLLMPQALGAAAATPLAGRFTDRLGAGVVVPVGIALALLGIAAYTQVGADTSYPVLACALFVIGLGLGATFMPAMAAAYQGLPRESIGKATSAVNTIQRVGASVGTAVAAAALQHAIDVNLPRLSGAALGPLSASARLQAAPALAHAFDTAFWLAFALTTAALVPAVLLPRARGGTRGPG